MKAEFILGVDTGGTYTDAVIYKAEAAGGTVVAESKSLTTKDDLCVGIIGAVSALDPQLLKMVSRVALSTTLATNACVEGRGGRCGLIIIGGDRTVVAARAGEFGLPDIEDICFLEGRIDLDGNEAEPFDSDARRKIAELLARMPCVAISGMLSCRNPVHEYAARDIVAELGGSSVCSIDVAPGELNYLRRASTALLNARLLPIIREFLESVTRALERLGISAPVSVVRSDGTLMSAEFAALRPVETLLSGPTASVVGALNLVEGVRDAVIADIGGTTTDLALVERGEPVKTGLGIEIGNWKTSVSSTYIDTFGLGGDSRVIIGKNGRLELCDERVVPLCNLSARYPGVLESLRELAESPHQGIRRSYELLELIKTPPEGELSGRERLICGLLSGGPLSVPELSRRAGFEILPTDLRLETRGYVIRAGFTPTDAMHILGLFSEFDIEASLLGARYFERHLGYDPRKLAEAVLDLASYKFYSGIVRLLAKRHIEGACEDFPPRALLEAAWACGDDALFRPAFGSAATLVAVGAPAKAIAGKAAGKLGMRLVVPEHAGVANAVGAAVCTVKCERSVFIRPSFDSMGQGCYIVMGGSGNAMYNSYDAALGEAKRRAAELAERDARRRGVTGSLEISVSEEKHDSTAMTDMGEVTVELGTTVTAVARAAGV